MDLRMITGIEARMKTLEGHIVFGYLLSFSLWYLVFLSDLLSSFWYRVTFASIILAVYANQYNEKPTQPDPKEILYGLTSGIILYVMFFVGFNLFRPLVSGGAGEVYLFRNELSLIVPSVLLLITSFCEEYFWRNYIQNIFVESYGMAGIAIASLLYASIHITTGNLPLIAAALIAGAFWGILYRYTESFWIVVFSHIAWTELIFVFLPLG